MVLRVVCYAGSRGDETPRRFLLGRRSVEVVKIVRQWLEPDHRYFKILGDDGTVYVLRYAEAAGEPHWELATHPIRGARNHPIF